MAQQQFKTNIKCGGCIAAVKPHLDGNHQIESWEVDTNNPNKILTVASPLETEEIIAIVKAAGYQAEAL
jgi:copper chaperone CopZ